MIRIILFFLNTVTVGEPPTINFPLMIAPQYSYKHLKEVEKWNGDTSRKGDQKLDAQVLTQRRKGATCSCLSLNWWREQSERNLTFHLLKEASKFWKINSFLIFQIFHAAQAKISSKQMPWKAILAWEIMSSLGPLVFQLMPMRFQQATANGHSKKRCILDSSKCLLQSTQSVPPSICHCFRFMISLVLSLSRYRSHRNTHNLGRHRDFQIAWTWGSHSTWEKRIV